MSMRYPRIVLRAKISVCFGCILAFAIVGPVCGEPAQPKSGTGKEPIRPAAAMQLFNGKDLTGLHTWLKESQLADPKQVLAVRNGVLHLSGEGNGYIATNDDYKDYHLTVEYKWGDRTDGGKYVRNSGVLLHATGPDGGAGGVWMSAIECQLAQGCVGDLIVIRGKDSDGSTIPVEITSDTSWGADKRPRWKTGGERRTFTKGQLWWSRHDPDFKELLDTRGKEDVESQLGEWTRVECICEKNRIGVLVNGTRVNECYDVYPSAGKILLQSEGFELFVRKFEIRPLP